jgi:predicted transcriptional regulator
MNEKGHVPTMVMAKVGDLMCPAVSARHDDSLRDALAMMVTRDFSQMPVTDEQGLTIGSIEESTLVREFADAGGSLPDTADVPVADWMGDPFVQVSPDMMLDAVSLCLVDRPAVTVDHDDGTVGWILTRADLSAHLLDNYSSIPRDAERWRHEHLESLCRERRLETATLEFKQQLPSATKESLARAVAAMANSCGGILLVGIRSENDRAVEITPIELGDATDNAIRQGVDSHLDPPLGNQLRIVSVQLPEDAGRGVVVLGVPMADIPHAIDGVFWLRTGTCRRPMREAEVRERYFRCRFLGKLSS